MHDSSQKPIFKLLTDYTTKSKKYRADNVFLKPRNLKKNDKAGGINISQGQGEFYALQQNTNCRRHLFTDSRDS